MTAQRCYCSDATCSAGGNGFCARQFEAAANTTDPAEVLRQLSDPQTLIARVSSEVRCWAVGSPCHLCFQQ